MALVRKLEKSAMQRTGVHKAVDCTYTVFQDKLGQRYLQIDTYGSARRQLPNKKSQTIQFGPDAIGELYRLLEEENLRAKKIG
jgi:hypothetical protein